MSWNWAGAPVIWSSEHKRYPARRDGILRRYTLRSLFPARFNLEIYDLSAHFLPMDCRRSALWHVLLIIHSGYLCWIWKFLLPRSKQRDGFCKCSMTPRPCSKKKKGRWGRRAQEFEFWTYINWFSHSSKNFSACKYPNFSYLVLLLTESLAYARAKQDYIQFNLRHVSYRSKPD